MTKNAKAHRVIFETTISNISCWATLAVAASSVGEAIILFAKAVASDEWKRQAQEEYQMALAEFSGLDDEERADANGRCWGEPTLAQFEYDWCKTVRGRQSWSDRPDNDDIYVYAEAPTEEQLREFGVVKMTSSGSGGWGS